MNPRLLIIEDDQGVAAAMEAASLRVGTDVNLAYSGRNGLSLLQTGDFTGVILDLGLPDMSGIQVLEQLRQRDPAIPVVVVTAHGTLDNVLAAQQLGVEDILIKPVDLAVFARTVRQLSRGPAPAPSSAASDRSMLVGSSPLLQRTLVRIAQACASSAPVLISGPSGSGKTLAARIIHDHGARSAGPFVTLTCGSLPEALLESELFGHERGAFTGATSMKIGHVERAAGGTLLLDEIGDISPAVQVRLLRLIDERVYSRVGGREDLRLDARIIAAANKSLAAEVRAGRFREDLFFRLHVLDIAMPSLRERPEDIPVLCDYFLASLAPGRSLQVGDEARVLLQQYAWPGNVRELRNALERAVAITSGHTIQPEHLPAAIREPAKPGLPDAEALPAALAAWLDARLGAGDDYDALLNELERLLLADLMKRHGGKSTSLARALHMNRVTLLNKRRRMGLD